jgi:gluconate 2-dehydrogenase gamma chain
VRVDRREVLARVAAIAAFAGLTPGMLAGCLREGRLRPAAGGAFVGGGRALTGDEWVTLAAVQETLWPAGEGVPGAHDVRATSVLDAALVDPDVSPAHLATVRAGLPRLHALASRRGAARFETLDAAGREAVLVAWRDEPEGTTWIRLVLGYTLEAVLGDPVYGGNPGGIGWTWAGYEPGDPPPPPTRGRAVR